MARRRNRYGFLTKTKGKCASPTVLRTLPGQPALASRQTIAHQTHSSTDDVHDQQKGPILRLKAIRDNRPPQPLPSPPGWIALDAVSIVFFFLTFYSSASPVRDWNQQKRIDDECRQSIASRGLSVSGAAEVDDKNLTARIQYE